VTPGHIKLDAAAIAVLGAGVYLFMEVRSGSAAAVPTMAAPEKPKPAEKEPAVVAAAQPAPVVKHTMPAPAPSAPSAPPPSIETHEEAPPPPPALNDDKANPKIEAVMDQANKAYDRQDYDEAKAIAGKVLTKVPTNVRMLRIMVSSSCIDGDVAVAQKYFPSLPKFDRDQMKVRCDRYGVTLTDPAQ